jgi:hypothetical protein
MVNQNSLSYGKIFKFWYPLAAAWLMMAVEGLFISAVIARCVDPKYNLAAFGIAFYIAVLMEAPIIMLMSASTALCKDQDSYQKLKRFTHVMNGIITFIMMIVIIPPLFKWIGNHLIKLPGPVTTLTHNGLLLMLPWPAAIGYRRFYQGILIRFNLTQRVAYGTIIRLTTMASTAIILYFFSLPGAYIGGIALTTGVICEAVASRLMVHKTLIKLKQMAHDSTSLKEDRLTYPFIIKFYYPLLLMTTLSLGIHPIATVFMGSSRMPLESLAVFPVINSFIFIFRSLGLSYQEVVIALLGEKNEGYIKLRNFIFFIGLCSMICLAVISFTPLLKYWYTSISGLSLHLAQFSYIPTRILIFLPGLTALFALQRSILVKIKKTSPITWSTLIEIFFIIFILYLTVYRFHFIGIIASAIAFNIGRLSANLYLLSFHRKAVREC